MNEDNADLWALMRLALKEFHSEHTVGGTDPLVLDLDGDGLELTAVGVTGGLFDMDGDHSPSRPAGCAATTVFWPSA